MVLVEVLLVLPARLVAVAIVLAILFLFALRLNATADIIRVDISS